MMWGGVAGRGGGGGKEGAAVKLVLLTMVPQPRRRVRSRAGRKRQRRVCEGKWKARASTFEVTVVRGTRWWHQAMAGAWLT